MNDNHDLRESELVDVLHHASDAYLRRAAAHVIGLLSVRIGNAATVAAVNNILGALDGAIHTGVD